MGNCLKRNKSPDSGDRKKDEEVVNTNIKLEGKKDDNKAEKKKKPKSWENRSKLDRENYKCCNKENEYLIKKPGFQ